MAKLIKRIKSYRYNRTEYSQSKKDATTLYNNNREANVLGKHCFIVTKLQKKRLKAARDIIKRLTDDVYYDKLVSNKDFILFFTTEEDLTLFLFSWDDTVTV